LTLFILLCFVADVIQSIYGIASVMWHVNTAVVREKLVGFVICHYTYVARNQLL